MSRVIVETCSEAFAVADAALTVGHEVRVVPGTLVRSLGVGARRLKSDRRDARILSEVSCRIRAVLLVRKAGEEFPVQIEPAGGGTRRGQVTA